MKDFLTDEEMQKLESNTPDFISDEEMAKMEGPAVEPVTMEENAPTPITMSPSIHNFFDEATQPYSGENLVKGIDEPSKPILLFTAPPNQDIVVPEELDMSSMQAARDRQAMLPPSMPAEEGYVPPAGITESLEAALPMAYQATKKGISGAVQAAAENIPVTSFPTAPIAEYMQNVGEGAEGEMQKIIQEKQIRPGTVGGFATDVTTSMAQFLPIVGMSIISPSVAPYGLGLLATVSGGDKYQRAKEAGFGEGEALAQGIAYGAAEAIGEKIGLDYLLAAAKNPAVMSGVRTIFAQGLKQAGVEGAEEGLTQIIQNATDIVAKKVNPNTTGEAPSIFQDVPYAMGVGAAAGGVTGGGLGALQSMMGGQQQAPPPQEPEVTPADVDTTEFLKNQNNVRDDVRTAANVEKQMQEAEALRKTSDEYNQLMREKAKGKPTGEEIKRQRAEKMKSQAGFVEESQIDKIEDIIREAQKAATQAQQAEAKQRKANVIEGLFNPQEEPRPVEGGRNVPYPKNDVIQEIRDAGLKTKDEVVAFFDGRHNITREGAGNLLKIAYNQPIPERTYKTPPSKPPAQPPTIDQLFKRKPAVTVGEAERLQGEAIPEGKGMTATGQPTPEAMLTRANKTSLLSEEKFWEIVETAKSQDEIRPYAEQVLKNKAAFSSDAQQIAARAMPEIQKEANTRYEQNKKDIMGRYERSKEFVMESIGGETPLLKKLGYDINGKMYRGVKSEAAINDLFTKKSVMAKTGEGTTNWAPDTYSRYMFDKDTYNGYIIESDATPDNFQTFTKFSNKYYKSKGPIPLENISRIIKIERTKPEAGVNKDTVGHEVIYDRDAGINKIKPTTPSSQPQQAAEVAPKDITAEPAVKTPEVKEPWQMTKEEFVEENRLGGPELFQQYTTEYGKTGKTVKDKLAMARYREQLDNQIVNKHQEQVKAALSEGKPVPPEVLAEYPELKGDQKAEPKPKKKSIPFAKGIGPSISEAEMNALFENLNEPRPKSGPGMFGGAQLQNAYDEVAPKIKRGLDIFKKKAKEFIADEEGFYSPEELANAVKAVKDKFIGKIKRGQSTQVTNTINTYAKILDRIADKAQGKTGDVRIVDVSTGLGMSEELARKLNYKNYETTEPFPAEGFVPTYKDSTQLPDSSFDFITNNQVLNVVPKSIRDGIVKDIGRALKEGGTAIISTRGKDVMDAKTGRKGEETMSLYIPAKDAQGKSYEQYQKGFTKDELKDYVQGLLGDGFDVKLAPFGAAGVEIIKTSKSAKTSVFKGKDIGGANYLHKKYEADYKQFGLDEAKSKLPKNFEYNIVKYDRAKKQFSFINSPDFDKVTEPTVGDIYTVSSDGEIKYRPKQKDPDVYHGKYEMVKEDYGGFDKTKAKADYEEFNELRKASGAKSWGKRSSSENIRPNRIGLFNLQNVYESVFGKPRQSDNRITIGDPKIGKKINDMSDRTEATRKNLDEQAEKKRPSTYATTKQSMIDVFMPYLDIVKNDSARYEQALSKLHDVFYIPSAVEGFLLDLRDEILTPVQKAGKTNRDYSAYRMAKWTLTGREKVKSPLSLKEAQDFIDSIDAPTKKLFEDITTKFHERVWKNVLKEVEATGLKDDKTINFIMDKENYATFFPAKQMGLSYGSREYKPSGEIFKLTEEGYTGDIQDVLTSLTQKGIAMITHANINAAKLEAFDILKTYSPGDITPAKQSMKGYTKIKDSNGNEIEIPIMEFNEPAPNSQMALLTARDKGKAVGYYVPKQFATSFDEALGSGEQLHDALRYFSNATQAIKNVWIDYNPPWQLFTNIIRDIPAAMIEMPGFKKPVKFAGKVIRNAPAAIGDYIPVIGKALQIMTGYDRAKFDAQVKKMLKEKKLLSSKDVQQLGDYNISVFDRIQNAFDTFPREGESKKFLQQVKAFGKDVERLVKTAFDETLVESQEFTDDEIVNMTRRGGSPAFAVRGGGKAFNVATTGLVFYNAVKEGWRAGKYFYQKDPVGFVIKASIPLSIFSFGVAAVSGAFGDEWKKAYLAIKKSDRENKLTFPLWWEPDGQVKYIALSMPQFLKPFMTAINEFGSADARILEGMADAFSNEIPSLNPVFDIAKTLALYGQNKPPIDRFGNPIMTQDQWTAGGPDKAINMLKAISNQNLFGSIYRFPIKPSEAKKDLFSLTSLYDATFGKILKTSFAPAMDTEKEEANAAKARLLMREAIEVEKSDPAKYQKLRDEIIKLGVVPSRQFMRSVRHNLNIEREEEAGTITKREAYEKKLRSQPKAERKKYNELFRK